MEKDRIYFCIDMKSFYASCECAEFGLNPFETCLAVTDESRGKNALCLAISPKMKALGVKNRCRLSDIPSNIEYIKAMPRMQLYIEYAADIYGIYLKYIDKNDIHVYSIDESFIDATDYLKIYDKTPREFAKFLIDEIAREKHIPATAGIGTNLYLAKIALDITAKHSSDHIGFLDEQTYKETLWDHKPITDFWQVASGTAARLAHCGMFTMRDVARGDKGTLYRLFGINAELLIDHANGIEPCTIADIKAYKGKSRSVSSSQILPSDYDYDKAKTVMLEMALGGCQTLMKQHLIAGNVSIAVSYSSGVAPTTGGSVRMRETTAVYSIVKGYVLDLYEKYARKDIPIRRLSINFGNVCDESCEGYDFFTDCEKIEREKSAEKTVLDLKSRFGKNAVLRGIDFVEGATTMERNTFIGGHKA